MLKTVCLSIFAASAIAITSGCTIHHHYHYAAEPAPVGPGVQAIEDLLRAESLKQHVPQQDCTCAKVSETANPFRLPDNPQLDDIIGLEVYAHPYLDPETKKPAGIQLRYHKESQIQSRYGSQSGDIIQSVNGVNVTGAQSLRGTIRKMRAEGVEVFVVKYLRDGEELTKTIKARKPDQ